MGLFHEVPVFERNSKVIILLFEIVRLSVLISPRNLYNLLKSIKEKNRCYCFSYDLLLSGLMLSLLCSVGMIVLVGLI